MSLRPAQARPPPGSRGSTGGLGHGAPGVRAGPPPGSADPTRGLVPSAKLLFSARAPHPARAPFPEPVSGRSVSTSGPRSLWFDFVSESRTAISPHDGREGRVGPAAPSARRPARPGIDPAACAQRISPNGFADDSTSFSLKADPRSSPASAAASPGHAPPPRRARSPAPRTRCPHRAAPLGPRGRHRAGIPPRGAGRAGAGLRGPLGSRRVKCRTGS